MIWQRSKIVFIALILLMATACSLLELAVVPANTPIPPPTVVKPAATVSITINTLEPTPLPLSSPTPEPAITLPETVAEARTEGVSFFYDEALISAAQVTHTTASSGRYGFEVAVQPSYFEDVPDFIEFQLQTKIETHFPALLVVQPLRAASGDLFPAYVDLAIRPVLIETALIAETATDTLFAWPDQRPVTQWRIVDFSNGHGVRYVTQISDSGVYYLYEGVSDDGQYYVWLQYPLTIQLGRDLNQLTNAEFEPDLRRLDLMMETLFVAPDASIVSSVPANEPGCINDSQYVDDVTIPDGTPTEPRTVFTKTWRIRNTGTCTWTAAYQFVQPDTPPLVTPLRVDNFTMPVVPPDEEVELSVSLLSPPIPGYFRSEWQLAAPTDLAVAELTPFGRTFYTEVTINRAAVARIPTGEWQTLNGDTVTFSADTITFNGQTCGGVEYNGRFIMGGELAEYVDLLDGSLSESGRRYFELIRTNCDLPGFDQFVWAHNPYMPTWLTVYNQPVWFERLTQQPIETRPQAALLIRVAEDKFLMLMPKAMTG